MLKKSKKEWRGLFKYPHLFIYPELQSTTDLRVHLTEVKTGAQERQGLPMITEKVRERTS